MRRIVIAGATGFIGGALYRRLATPQGEFPCRAIPRELWHSARNDELSRLLADCDCCVMAAGESRNPDQSALYRVNMELAQLLVQACERCDWRGTIYFISTTHEAKDTPYHASKRDSRALFDAWATRSGGRHIGILLPNTFGPGGKIAYNSAVCTFAWQIAHRIEPTILQDAPVALCDIDSVTRQLMEWLRQPPATQPAIMAPLFEYRVSEIINRLRRLHSGAEAVDNFDQALHATLIYAAGAQPFL